MTGPCSRARLRRSCTSVTCRNNPSCNAFGSNASTSLTAPCSVIGTTFLSANDDRETFPAAHCRCPGLLRPVPVDVPVGPASEDLFQRDPALHPRKRGAEAEVDANTETQVPVDSA